MKIISLCLLLIFLLGACSATPDGSILLSESDTTANSIHAEIPSPLPTASLSPSSIPRESPSPKPVPVDGPSILDRSDVSSMKYPAAVRFFDPERAVPYDEDSATDIENTIVEICDNFFQTYCDSITAKEEIDLSHFYDLSTEIRVKDWIFNQMWLYGQVEIFKDETALEYLGSNYAFMWDYWDFDRQTGIISVFTKTGLLREYNNGERIIFSQNDGDWFTHEFAFTYKDGKFKIIRFRDFFENYMSLQLRVINAPSNIEDIEAGRLFIDTLLQ